MDTSLQKVFSYNEAQVRVVMKDDEPWFVAKDTCEILEYVNTPQAVGKLDEDEKGICLIDTLGGPQEMLIINEPGLYSLILTSRKPEAKAFKRWITHEVLPSIRKTGKYEVIDSETEKLRRADAMLLNARTRQANLMRQMAKEFKDILSPESVQLLIAGASEIAAGKPLLPKPSIEIHFTATEIGEEIGVSANKVGRVSNKNNLKTSEYGMWVLDKSASSDKQVKTFVYNERGRQKLLDLLSEEMPTGTEA